MPQTNTDVASSAMKQEPGTGIAGHSLTNGISAAATNGDTSISISPTETHRTITTMLQAGATAAAQQQAITVTATPIGDREEHAYLGVNSSPLQARANLLSGLNRTASASPFRQDLGSAGQREGLVAGSRMGMGRFGFR